MRCLGLTVPSMIPYLSPILRRWTATMRSMLVHWDTITLQVTRGNADRYFTSHNIQSIGLHVTNRASNGDNGQKGGFWSADPVENLNKVETLKVLPFLIRIILSYHRQFRENCRNLEKWRIIRHIFSIQLLVWFYASVQVKSESLLAPHLCALAGLLKDLWGELGTI